MASNTDIVMTDAEIDEAVAQAFNEVEMGLWPPKSSRLILARAVLALHQRSEILAKAVVPMDTTSMAVAALHQEIERLKTENAKLAKRGTLRWESGTELSECFLGSFRVGYIYRSVSGRNAIAVWGAFALTKRGIGWFDTESEARTAVETAVRYDFGIGLD